MHQKAAGGKNNSDHIQHLQMDMIVLRMVESFGGTIWQRGSAHTGGKPFASVKGTSGEVERETEQ